MAECPPYIRDLIGLANLAGSQGPVDLGDEWMKAIEGNNYDLWAVAAAAASKLPRTFQAHVGPIRPDSRHLFIQRWSEVHRAWQTLTAIVKTADGPVDLAAVLGRRVVDLRRDDAGQLQIALTDDMQTLKGLEASRVARCRGCGRFLWMERLRSKPLCSNACRQAAWRKENPEKYRRIQIENERTRAQQERGRRRIRQRAKQMRSTVEGVRERT